MYNKAPTHLDLKNKNRTLQKSYFFLFLWYNLKIETEQLLRHQQKLCFFMMFNSNHSFQHPEIHRMKMNENELKNFSWNVWAISSWR